MMRTALVIAVAFALTAATPWIGPELHADTASFVFWQLRVPRTLVGVLVGSTLGLVGAVFQTLFGNPLATPSTVGTTAGASLGALAAVLGFGSSIAVGGLPVVAVAAFLGALVVTLGVASVASSGRARVDDVLLAGIALSLAAGAITTGLQLQADMAATFEAVRWSLGHLGQVGYHGVLILLPFVLATHLVLLSQLRGLAALVAGEDRAHGQGVDVVRLRTLCLGAGAAGVGACVAWVGPIAFVGLIVPHIVRRTLGAARHTLLPMSSVVGAAFLTVCDALGRSLMPGQELPVGVLTALIGAPVLVWLVTRR